MATTNSANFRHFTTQGDNTGEKLSIIGVNFHAVTSNGQYFRLKEGSSGSGIELFHGASVVNGNTFIGPFCPPIKADGIRLVSLTGGEVGVYIA